MRIATIYVFMLEEGTDCWRPVNAEHLHDDLYKILDTPDDDEVWQFNQGDVVRCRRRVLSGDGGRVDECLVACEKSHQPPTERRES